MKLPTNIISASIVFVLATACGQAATQSKISAESSTSETATKLDQTMLFYKYELNALAAPVLFRPDYDSGLVLTIGFEAASTTPVLKTFYDTATGFHSMLALNLTSGSLRFEEGQMGNQVNKDFAAPAVNPQTMPEYLSLLKKLQTQVVSIRDGRGIDNKRLPELANATAYLDQVVAEIEALGSVTHTL